MKRLNKTILSLTTLLFIAGCTEEVSYVANPAGINDALISNAHEDVAVGTLNLIYEDLKEQNGGSYATQKMLEMIAQEELNLDENEELNQLYLQRVEKELDKLTTNSNYFVNGNFSEELLVRDLRSQMYEISCPSGFGPSYSIDDLKVEDKLLCDYSNYVDGVVKSKVLSDLLKEKYIYDKVMVDNANFIESKKARVVEYFTIDKDSDNVALDFMTSAIEKIVNGTTFEQLQQEWYDSKVEKIMDEYEKIGTSNDTNFSVYYDFSFDGKNYRTIEEGLLAKKREVYSQDLVSNAVFTSDSKGGLSLALVDRIISDNVLTNKSFKIGDDYFLISPLALGNVDEEDIIILDNNKYYFIKVSVVNNESSDSLLRSVVEVLKNNASTVKDSITFYLKKYEINVHDIDIYEYLKTQYPTIFTE